MNDFIGCSLSMSFILWNVIDTYIGFLMWFWWPTSWCKDKSSFFALLLLQYRPIEAVKRSTPESLFPFEWANDEGYMICKEKETKTIPMPLDKPKQIRISDTNVHVNLDSNVSSPFMGLFGCTHVGWTGIVIIMLEWVWYSREFDQIGFQNKSAWLLVFGRWM